MPDNAQNEPVKNYPPWVGVVLAFFIPGASHFLAGKKLVGVAWFSFILLSGLCVMWCLASPVVPGDLPGGMLWILSIALWILMLVKSRRPIPRLQLSGWTVFVVSAIFLHVYLIDGIHIFFRSFKMPTASMSPTLEGNRKQADGTAIGGDRFFIEAYAYWFKKPSRGDIVAFTTDGVSPLLPSGQFFLKRIVGVPGDILSIHDGHLFNRDKQILEPAALQKLKIINPPVGNQPYLATSNDTFKVSEGQYFVIGDNTTNSFDSRFWGTVSEINIIGKVSKIWWPLDHAGNIQ